MKDSLEPTKDREPTRIGPTATKRPRPAAESRAETSARSAPVSLGAIETVRRRSGTDGHSSRIQPASPPVDFGRHLQRRPLPASAGVASASSATDAPPPDRGGAIARIPDGLRVGIEELSGFDLGDVRVHQRSDAPGGVDALAFAQGNDIHLAPGQEQHLPHEAWHVVQQRQGRVRPMAQFKGRQLNDDPSLEREADLFGARAARIGRSAPEIGPASWSPAASRLRRSPADPVQRVPIKKPDSDTLYIDSDHPTVELIPLGADAYRLKGTEQTVHWKADSYQRKHGAAYLRFDMAAYASNPQFLDFMSMYEEVETATAVGGDDQVKLALRMHVLQRFMVNALYSADEISKMDYQASPLNFQESGSYIRSHATAFVDALRKFIGATDQVHLVRDRDFNSVMAQFLDRIDAKALGPDISGKADQVAQFLLDAGNLKRFGDANGMILADATEHLAGPLDVMQPALDEIAKAINAKIFADTSKAVIAKFVQRACGDLTSEEQAAVCTELGKAVKDSKTADLGQFIALANRHGLAKFDAKNVEDLRAITASRDRTRAPEDAKVLALTFRNEMAPYKKWLGRLGRALDDPEQKFLDAKGDTAAKFVDLVTSDSFRAYFASKSVEVGDRAYAPITAKSAETDHLGKLKLLLVTLGQQLPDITMVAGSVLVGEQPAFLLASRTSEQLVKMVEFGLNKAGYVPTPTSASRAMLTKGHGLQEIIAEVATQQQQHSKKTAVTDKIVDFIAQMKRFDPLTYVSRIDATDQLLRTKAAFVRFQSLLDDDKEWVTLQAASVGKLIVGMEILDDGRGTTSIALEELRVNLDDAIANKDDIAAYIRNIQNIHEALILEMERDPVAAAARVADAPLRIPAGAKNPHFTDYGLKAFAQAYNAMLAASDADTLHVDAYSSIYFELLHKLNQVKTTGGTDVSLRNPKDLAEYQQFGKDLDGVAIAAPQPDLVIIDIHPNDASKTSIAEQQVRELIDAMMSNAGAEHHMTVIVDITLDHIADPAVAAIKDAAQRHIDSGRLNLVFIQSLAKFAQLGSDKQSGGLMFHYNNDDPTWKRFNESVAKSTIDDPADRTVETYLRTLLKYTEDEQRRYIDKVRENTKFVHAGLTKEFARLGKVPKTLELSVSDDPGACYVAFNYEELAAQLFVGGTDDARDLKTEGLGKDILNDAIYELVHKLKLPLSMRQSFGFPISNLGEAWVGSRFTIGTETNGMLEQYISLITYVKARLGQVPPEVLKNEKTRKATFKSFSTDIATIEDLRAKLDPLLVVPK